MRIAIVNDLALARDALRRVVLSRPGYQVAWVAEDGDQAVRLARQDRPDVILMDLIMPGMDGVEATRQIMEVAPCDILVVTATVAGNHALAMQAMSHGALDAVHTPELGLDGRPRRDQELLTRLERLGRSRRSSDKPSVHLTPPPTRPCSALPPLVALGASTGGPGAIARVLERLPPSLNAPVLVVQHISAEFASDLIAWLRGQSRLPVEPAHEGGSPAPGVVWVAVTNDHLILTADHRFHYRREPADEPFRPNIDLTFESLASCWPTPGAAALLTGMGDDGARGLGLLRRAGWFTIAQDEATCVVYGMPRAAVEQHAASRVLPVGEVAGAILARLTSARA